MKRRTAVHKISSLPEATPLQLRSFDDVCAICYQEMTSAKITRCKHYFHGVCLRKWLYVQDRCPLCHEIIMNQDGKNGNGNGEEDGDDNDRQDPNQPPNAHTNTPLDAANSSTAASSSSSNSSNSTLSTSNSSNSTSGSSSASGNTSNGGNTSATSIAHSLSVGGFRIQNPASVVSSSASLPLPSSASLSQSAIVAANSAAISQLIRQHQQHQSRSSADRDFTDELE